MCHVWRRAEKDQEAGPTLGKGGWIKMGKSRYQLTGGLGKPLVPEKSGMGLGSEGGLKARYVDKPDTPQGQERRQAVGY